MSTLPIKYALRGPYGTVHGWFQHHVSARQMRDSFSEVDPNEFTIEEVERADPGPVVYELVKEPYGASEEIFRIFFKDLDAAKQRAEKDSYPVELSWEDDPIVEALNGVGLNSDGESDVLWQITELEVQVNG